MCASPLLVFIGLTGAAITYQPQLDALLNPRLFRTAAAGPPLPLDSLLVRVQQALPGKPVVAIQLAATPRGTTVFRVPPIGDVFVQPATGAILGVRSDAQRVAGLASRLNLLHRALLLGDRGRFIVRWGTIAALYLAITGIVLWWPDKIFSVRATASWKRINFDLHHIIGVLASVVIVITAGTGLLISLPDVNAAIAKAAGSSVDPRFPQPRAAPGAHFARLDQVRAAAAAAMPGATVAMISMPVDSSQPYRVTMHFPEDHAIPGGRSFVAVDRYRGTVLGQFRRDELLPGTRLLMLERDLHTGGVLGTPTAIVWMLASLAIGAQGVTGLLMWWHARRGRKGLRQRARSSGEANHM